MKRPAFQWYPGDWRRDTALESCSIEARGLWIEMLNLMHDGEPYGHLTAGGVPIDAAALGNLTGVPPLRLSKILKELELRKIFSRTADGLIYSRRMVRDEALRNRRAAGGKLGGNPALVGRKDNGDGPSEDTEVPRKVNHDPTPATATATTAVASATEQQVVVGAKSLANRANDGLAEHPDRPQPKPLIRPDATRSIAATTAILAAGVPLAFAEARVYELARSHVCEGKVTSLNYFRDDVIRKWQEQTDSMNGSGRPRRRATPSTVGDQSYAEATAAFAALNESNGRSETSP